MFDTIRCIVDPSMFSQIFILFPYLFLSVSKLKVKQGHVPPEMKTECCTSSPLILSVTQKLRALEVNEWILYRKTFLMKVWLESMVKPEKVSVFLF